MIRDWGHVNVSKTFEEPIHLACRLGLNIMVDQLLFRAPAKNIDSAQNSQARNLQSKREISLTSRFLTRMKLRAFSKDQVDVKRRYVYHQFWFNKLGNAGTARVLDNLYQVKNDYPGGSVAFLGFLLATNVLLRTAWLADKQITSEESQLAELKELYGHIAKQDSRDMSYIYIPSTGHDLENDVAKFLQEHGNDQLRVRKRLHEVLEASAESKEQDGPVWDRPDIDGRLPLYLAAPFPKIVKRLIEHGADINKLSNICATRRNILGSESVLLSILLDLSQASATQDGSKIADDLARDMLESAKILIFEGADLTITGNSGETLLHLAAAIRDLKFFKLLCVSGSWNVHARCADKYTALHYLFRWDRPTSQKKVDDTLEILRILIQMRRPDGDDLVNAQDKYSRNPLSWAVHGGFKEAIPLFLELGVDIHDDDSRGQNLFHDLSKSRYEYGNTQSAPLTPLRIQIEIETANVLLETGLDPTRPGNGRNTPLLDAISRRRWHLVDILLEKYAQIGARNPGRKHPILIRDIAGTGVLYLAVSGSSKKESGGGFFKRIVELLAGNEELKTAITLPNYSHNTPLHQAVFRRDLEVIKCILSLGIESTKTVRNSQGYTALDLAFYEVLTLPQHLDGETSFEAVEELNSVKEIASYILNNSSNVPVSFVLALLSVSGNSGPIAMDPWVQEKIANYYDANFRDHSGWSLYDALCVAGRTDLAPGFGLSQQQPFPEGRFQVPSRIGQVIIGEREISEDGLRCSMPEPDENGELENGDKADNLGPSSTELVSDHPVPPTSEFFYFEVQISEAVGLHGGTLKLYHDTELVYVPSKHAREAGTVLEGRYYTEIVPISYFDCQVGYRAINSEGGSVLYSFRESKIQATPWWKPDPLSYDESIISAPEESWAQDKPNWIGCGVNLRENAFFFTVDGKVVAAIELDRPWQWFPAIHHGYKHEPFEINFGAKPFIFKKANDPTWRWNHKIHGEALSKGPID
ncbi:hypothetical protein TWF281_003351 [Arthrobotrys megalospora]